MASELGLGYWISWQRIFSKIHYRGRATGGDLLGGFGSGALISRVSRYLGLISRFGV